MGQIIISHKGNNRNMSTFWKNIKEEIEKIVKREIPSDILFYLLGVILVNDFAEQRYILHILLLIAKKNHQLY